MNGLDEIFRMAAQVAGMGLLAVVALLWVIYTLHRIGITRRICRCLHLARCSSCWIGRLCVVPMACVLIVMGSEKPGGDGVSSVPRRLLRLIRQVVTSNDVACGYRVVEGTESGGVVPMPSGAVTNELLRRRGGYDYAFRVEPEGWRFPYRDGFLEGVTVLACGEVRPDIGTLYFPVPITNGVSLLPKARWGLLPNAEAQSRRDASVFWHGMTASNSLVLTWENALVGRDLNSPTNLQLELFRDGSFTWRTDDSSKFYLPVFPFDWDGDGLENSVDPEPLFANLVDAHNTNAEWYRIVCSNVFTTVSQPNSSSIELPGGDEIYFQTNANPRVYYFVDVVASDEPVPIYFTADGTSDLGDPAVVALANVTNHVPLLLGATYSVTSTVPFAVYVPTNEVVEVTTNSPSDYVIRRPLSITVNGDGDDGRFSIDEDGRIGGTVYSDGECCCDLAAAGLRCGWDNSCSCHGCTNTYFYGYCGYALPLGVYGCGCNPDSEAVPTTPAGASFSITFSEPAVIFEDEYDNSSTDHVDRNSTYTVLTIRAEGGLYGGSFELTNLEGFEKLCTLNGDVVVPELSDEVEPGQSYVRNYICEGLEASAEEDDIKIEGVFVEENTGGCLVGRSKLTVIQVELEVEDRPPTNPVPNRHIYGLREKVFCRVNPSGVGISWNVSDSNLSLLDGGFRCPWTNGEYTVSATLEDTKLNIPIHVYEPTVECRSAMWRSELVGQVGMAGQVGMSLALYLQPSTVSFANIWMQEIPVPSTLAIPSTGYFLLFPNLLPATHDVSAGAGRWRQPIMTNDGNYWCDDGAQMPHVCPSLPNMNPPAWSEGTKIWHIPVGWGDGFTLFNRMQQDPTTQVYEMEADGTLSILKYSHTIKRSTDNRIWLDGNRVNAWWNR